MKSKLFAFCLVGLTSACDYTPSEPNTGKEPPPAAQIYALEPAEAPRFLDANLEATNALSAEFTVVNDVLVPMQVAGAFPESAGADANLQDGVGFGTYANPEYSVDGAWGGLFQSVLTAEVILSQPGDAVKFCRSFATTCVTAQMAAPGQGVLLLALAANVPDTEIGQIASGISAAVRGTGESGLTIAVTDPTVVAVPFTPAVGVPFELTWKVSRGQLEGSLDYAVAIDGTELKSGNTLGDLSGSITKQGGVALIFDSPVVSETKGEVDYSYTFAGLQPGFTNVLNTPVDLSPQIGLGFSPLYVYPTVDPGYELLTLSGEAGVPHAVQPTDAVLGAVIEPPGSAPQTKIYSAAFNGDDFAAIGGPATIDQDLTGGGFYPSPSFCYSQVFSALDAQVRAGARKEAHRKMYAAIANGIAEADAGLQQLAGAFGVTYTRLGDVAAEDYANYILIGTDYADSNVDTNIATLVNDTYSATLNQAVSQTFREQLNAIMAAWQASGGFPGADDPQAGALLRLQAGLNTPRGSKDGVVAPDGAIIGDEPPTICNGYDCQVAAVIRDMVTGRNDTGKNPPPQGGGLTPLLAHACLWGLPPTAEQPATPAVFRDTEDSDDDGEPEEDAPAYAAVPASPAVPPVREQAATQLNTLVVGIYANFIGQAFGPPVPASNFSLSMTVGSTETGTAPAVSSIVISTVE